MKPAASELLRDAIRDGTFPDSEDLLSAEIDSNAIPALLKEISQTRQELNEEIRSTSRIQAGDVDEWIKQAKKAQEDIARCKVEARQIVVEHERVQALRGAAQETKEKERLIQDEIDFTESLSAQMRHIAQTSKAFADVEASLLQGYYLTAAQGTSKSRQMIEEVGSSQTKTLLLSMYNNLRQKIQETLVQTLEDRLTVKKEERFMTLKIHSDGNSASDPTKTAYATTAEVFSAFDALGELDIATSTCARKLEGCVIPALVHKSKSKATKVVQKGQSLEFEINSKAPTADQIIDILTTVLQYLIDNLPEKGQTEIMSKLLEKILPVLGADWLDPAIPIELGDFHTLSNLQDGVEDFATKLNGWKLPGAEALRQWRTHIPRTWLAKRRMRSLDAVRKAFSQAQGVTRQVERVEKQMVRIASLDGQQKKDEDDWNASWEDDEPTENKDVKASGEDDADAWGFGEGNEERKPPNGSTEHDQGGDEGDAWGWNDEDENMSEEDIPQSVKKVLSATSNGVEENQQPRQESKQQELVLTENYSITDIPDHILELVGKDVQDAEDLQSSTTVPQSLSTSSSSLANIPTLTLAMFRAVAPTLYTQIAPSASSVPLSYINLYNDCLYMSAKLSSNFPQFLSSEASALTKFARTLYSQSMEVQRTILTDLLDNAQGFVCCTRPPYADECATAIASTVDRLRAVHKEWSTILSPSHLQQAIGALLNTIIRKMIKDIEDMEDISEPESRLLHQFCEDISALQDLFTSRPLPTVSSNDHHQPSTTNPAQEETQLDAEAEHISSVAVYVPYWLRFQYLTQILDSSLVDIRYLWTDAGLALEFSADEVIDLIKALFAESPHRRSAIVAVRETGNS